MYDKAIERKILQIVKEHNSVPNGISKTELTRIFTQKWGTSKTTIWEYILEMIDVGKIELRKTTKVQGRLFIPA